MYKHFLYGCFLFVILPETPSSKAISSKIEPKIKNHKKSPQKLLSLKTNLVFDPPLGGPGPPLGAPYGAPIWGPHMGPPYGAPVWGPNMGPPCGAPKWGPKLKFPENLQNIYIAS